MIRFQISEISFFTRIRVV